jgi:hypothetical protein
MMPRSWYLIGMGDGEFRASAGPEIKVGETIGVVEATPEVLAARELRILCEATFSYLQLEEFLEKDQLLEELARVLRIVKRIDPCPQNETNENPKLVP